MLTIDNISKILSEYSNDKDQKTIILFMIGAAISSDETEKEEFIESKKMILLLIQKALETDTVKKSITSEDYNYLREKCRYGLEILNNYLEVK